MTVGMVVEIVIHLLIARYNCFLRTFHPLALHFIFGNNFRLISKCSGARAAPQILPMLLYQKGNKNHIWFRKLIFFCFHFFFIFIVKCFIAIFCFPFFSVVKKSDFVNMFLEMFYIFSLFWNCFSIKKKFFFTRLWLLSGIWDDCCVGNNSLSGFIYLRKFKYEISMNWQLALF